MSEYDRQIRTMQDAIGSLGSPAAQLKALQQLAARFTPSGDQLRRALTDVGRVGEQAKVMQDMIGRLVPPAEQMKAMQKRLAIQRRQLAEMTEQIEEMEQTLSRFADAAEQLKSLGDPFSRLASAIFQTDRKEEKEDKDD